jgi:UDP-glucose:(heptosyl)LPS alpha-1,3-glucosyltransferase
MAQDSRITFVANSVMTKNDLENYLNLSPKRIVTIKNGFDNSHIKPPSSKEKHNAKLNLGINPDLPFALFVGSGFERKGAHLLAKVAEIYPNIQIGIVGKDKYLAQLINYVHRKKLQTRVFVYGPQKGIDRFYEAADIFCLPSLYDSFSNAVLEALAYGLPCVLTPNVGMHDAVNLFYAGTSCERNIESIADAIKKALNNQPQLSANALSLSNKYSSENSSEAWAMLYQSIMNSKVK